MRPRCQMFFASQKGGKLNEAFVKVLAMAPELEWVKVGQMTVAVDGGKVLANASKHWAVS
jgi:hypothetical protein